ncbi:fibronectin type III domain-containing protein [bacterium]|nr:fibronectin type III domain-containing protein [bacterium]
MARMTLMSLALLVLCVPSYADSANASWDANSEPDLAGYKVHYGTEPSTYTTTLDIGNSTTVTIDSLQANTTYYFAVTAYDLAGNESAFSAEVSLFIPPPPDTTAPAPPTNVTIVLSTAARESN